MTISSETTSNEATSLLIKNLGLIDYQLAWDKQRQLQSDLINSSGKEAFLFCEHNPVLSYGSSCELSEVLRTKPADLNKKGIQLIKSDRGGNITFHGKGQLVCYFILDLKKRRQDVAWYLRSLEQGIVELLKLYNIRAYCIPSKTGVWVSDTDKICSIGIRISRWCTMHGLSLNYSKISETGFRDIIPCGISDAQVTSIERINGQAPQAERLMEQLSEIFIKRFFTDFSVPYTQI